MIRINSDPERAHIRTKKQRVLPEWNGGKLVAVELWQWSYSGSWPVRYRDALGAYDSSGTENDLDGSK